MEDHYTLKNILTYIVWYYSDWQCVVYCGLLYVVVCGLLWSIVVVCGVLWSIVVVCGVLWSIVVVCAHVSLGMLWFLTEQT